MHFGKFKSLLLSLQIGARQDEFAFVIAQIEIVACDFCQQFHPDGLARRLLRLKYRRCFGGQRLIAAEEIGLP